METVTEKSSFIWQDFPLICRMCLNKTDLVPFERADLINLFTTITDIKVDPDDDLPRNACRVCINLLQQIYFFINISQESDVFLRKVLSKTKQDVKLFDGCSIDYSPEDKIECFDQKEKTEHIDYKYNTEAIKEEIDFENKKRSVRHSTKGQASDCEVCGETFVSKSKLTDHQRKNSNCKVKRYKCINCEKEFLTKFKLQLHLRIHTKETPFKCKICEKKFRHSANLKRHDDIVHKGLKPFKCDICEKEFATFLRRTEHLRIHTGERPHICSYCGIGFKKYSTRYAHEMRHKIKNGEIPKSDKKPKKYLRKKPEDPSELECKTCKKNFSSKQALCVHMQIHLGEKSFLCTVCGKGFLRKSHLEVHIRIHTGEKPYKCSDCGKYFRQAACFRNHLLIHKGERLYKCDVCQRTFIQLGHLQSHLKTHTGEKPYTCTFCGKGFAQNGNLKAHTRIHTGERPYRCPMCYMGFYDSTSLKKHKLSHGRVEKTENKFAMDNNYKDSGHI